jgi:ABC-type sugar transport system ATPase subunit
MNFVDGRIEASDGTLLFTAEGVRLALPHRRFAAAAAAGPARLTLGIRPEDLDVVPPGGEPGADRIEGRVVLIERLGGTSHVHVDAGPHRLLAAVADERLPEVGEPIVLRACTDRAHLFGPDGRSLA